MSFPCRQMIRSGFNNTDRKVRMNMSEETLAHKSPAHQLEMIEVSY